VTRPEPRPSPASEEEPVAQVKLSAAEAEAVADLADSYARALPPGREQPYVDLVEAARSGAVEGPLVATLEQVCATALETGQARRIGLAEVETQLAGVYRRTPQGRARLAEVARTNQALALLCDKRLRTARVAWQRPGRYTVTLGVEGFDLTLAVESTGLQISSLTTS
jgi:hypothetical protein